MSWDEVLKVIQIPKVSLDAENKPPEYEPPKDCSKVWNEIIDLVEDFIAEHLLTLENLDPFRTFRQVNPWLKRGRFTSWVEQNDTGWDIWARGLKDKGWSIYFEHNAKKDVTFNFPFFNIMLQMDTDATEEEMCNGLYVLANTPAHKMQKFHVTQEEMYYLEHPDGSGKDMNIGENIEFGLQSYFAGKEMVNIKNQGFAMVNFSVELNNFKGISSKEVDSRANSDYWFKHSSELINKIRKLATDWAKRNNRLKKSEEHPLGSITEYHGTVDIGTVLQEGIRGSSPKTRSNRHVPKKLRNVETISYTSDNPEEALKFAERRAKFLQIPEENVGVVGVRGRDLPKPIIHSDIIMEGETYVREGGIPVKYLVRLG